MFDFLNHTKVRDFEIRAIAKGMLMTNTPHDEIISKLMKEYSLGYHSVKKILKGMLK